MAERNRSSSTTSAKCPRRSYGDWTEYFSSSGKRYFYNVKTEVSQWEKPQEWREHDRAAQIAANAQIQQQPHHSQQQESTTPSSSGRSASQRSRAVEKPVSSTPQRSAAQEVPVSATPTSGDSSSRAVTHSASLECNQEEMPMDVDGESRDGDDEDEEVKQEEVPEEIKPLFADDPITFNPEKYMAFLPADYQIPRRNLIDHYELESLRAEARAFQIQTKIDQLSWDIKLTKSLVHNARVKSALCNKRLSYVREDLRRLEEKKPARSQPFAFSQLSNTSQQGPSQMRHRVVITGLGALSPLGVGVKALWNGLKSSQGGLRYSEKLGAVVGEVADFPIDRWSRGEQREMSRGSMFALLAAEECIQDAKLDSDPENTGVNIGMGIADLQMIEETAGLISSGKSKRVTPYFVPRILTNMPTGYVSMKYGFKGGNMSSTTACATGASCVGDAATMVSLGRVRRMIAGAVESCVNPIAITGFNRLRALARGGSANISRPFDRSREGFVLSEGGALVMLERLEDARERGAPIYAEVIGYGVSSDAYHLTSPDESGIGGLLCMRRCLEDAGIGSDQVSYVNAHATSTPMGDRIEAKSIASLCPSVASSSIKGHIGHCLAGAGSIETVATALMVQNGELIGNLNLSDSDVEEDVRLLSANEKWDSGGKRRIALINSFGFGGANVSVCLAQRMSLFGSSSFGANRTSSVFGSTAATNTNTANPLNDVEVPQTPDDTVQALKFNKLVQGQPVFLAACGWDNTVRIWQVSDSGACEAKAMQNVGAPILDIDWVEDSSKIFIVSADKQARVWDLASNQLAVVGTHDAPIGSCHWITSANYSCLMTGSYDKTLRFWDMRQLPTQSALATVQLPERVFCSDVVFPMAAVALGNRHVKLYNLENSPTEVKDIESPLKYQSRCISIFRNKTNNQPTGFALGSIEGRVAIQYAEPTNPKDNFTFKCHRSQDMPPGQQYQEIFAVNDLAFHPQHGTMATCGSDGRFSYWDKDQRIKLKTFDALPNAITKCSIHDSGMMFAYAVGYDWSKGHEFHNAASAGSKIFLHPCNEEMKPRAKK